MMSTRIQAHDHAIDIHFRAEPTVNRGLQQATHQLVGVGG
ncbi:hypothetical protein FRC0024_02085 [Corynebacterium diphtheriae]|nr:hypothetical protein FRC0024_02085 [Corynebacterium diphtheriae]